VTANPTPVASDPIAIAGFANKTSTLSAAQRSAISKQVKTLKPRQITCTALYSSKTPAKDLAIFKSRAKNTCEHAKAALKSVGRSVTIVLAASKTAKSPDIGKVIFSLKG
jgi:hypothetical protein